MNHEKKTAWEEVGLWPELTLTPISQPKSKYLENGEKPFWI